MEAIVASTKEHDRASGPMGLEDDWERYSRQAGGCHLLTSDPLPHPGLQGRPDWRQSIKGRQDRPERP